MHVPSLSFPPSNVSPFSLESNQSVVLLCSFLPSSLSVPSSRGLNMGHVERGTCLQGAPTKDDDMWFGPKTQGTARSALDSESNIAKYQ